jgi:hypothetical protein
MKTYRALLSETLVALLPGDSKPNETHIDNLIEFETKFANVSAGSKCGREKCFFFESITPKSLKRNNENFFRIT